MGRGLIVPSLTKAKICFIKRSNVGKETALSDRSNDRYEALWLNGANEMLFRSRRSFLPISMKFPLGARQRQDSCSISPVNEFRITSAPRPLVARMRSVANDIDRDENMRSSGIPYSVLRKRRFSSEPTVTYISACR